MLFAIGTLWFWLLLAAFLILEFLFIEAWENGIGATIVLVSFVGVHWLWGDPSILEWIKANPETIAVGVLVYFMVGCLWGFVKWFLYLKDKAREYQEERLNFLRRRGVEKATLATVVPPELRQEWKQSYGVRKERPLAVENKKRIVTWMAYWPWSAVWTLIRDPFVHMYNFCAERLEDMSSRVFDSVGFEEDKQVPPVEVEMREDEVDAEDRRARVMLE